MFRKILLADDDADLLFLTEMTLSEAGYEVTTVTNGKDAVAAAQKESFDLILLDADMPVMNGFEAFKSLSANPVTSRVPVVFITARPPDSETLEDLGVQVVDYLLKPYDSDQLAKQLETILHRR